MPRRDLVLTGIIAFAAGCAVGANWPKIRKKIGPMIGKAGWQISELGEMLSESFPEGESFFNAATEGMRDGAAKASASTSKKNGKVSPESASVEADFIPAPTPARKPARRKTTASRARSKKTTRETAPLVA